MNIYSQFRKKIVAQIEGLVASGDLPDGLDLSRITLEPPRDASHGDIATNAAMVLAKPAGTNPRALAEQIVAGLVDDADVEAAEVAGPGFINITLLPSAISDALGTLDTPALAAAFHRFRPAFVAQVGQEAPAGIVFGLQRQIAQNLPAAQGVNGQAAISLFRGLFHQAFIEQFLDKGDGTQLSDE